MLTVADQSRGSETVTQGLRVRVQPFYLQEQSDPSIGRWVFGYRIRITNEGEAPAKLLTRRWRIVDSQGRERVVEGEGVVGHQPLLEPGQSFEYSSYCPLESSWGTMEGEYGMEREDGESLEVRIARFYLAGPRSERAAAR